MADIFFIRSDNHETTDHACGVVKQNLPKLAPECMIDQFDGPNVLGRKPYERTHSWLW